MWCYYERFSVDFYCEPDKGQGVALGLPARPSLGLFRELSVGALGNLASFGISHLGDLSLQGVGLSLWVSGAGPLSISIGIP